MREFTQLQARIDELLAENKDLRAEHMLSSGVSLVRQHASIKVFKG